MRACVLIQFKIDLRILNIYDFVRKFGRWKKINTLLNNAIKITFFFRVYAVFNDFLNTIFMSLAECSHYPDKFWRFFHNNWHFSIHYQVEKLYHSTNLNNCSCLVEQPCYSLIVSSFQEKSIRTLLMIQYWDLFKEYL